MYSIPLGVTPRLVSRTVMLCVLPLLWGGAEAAAQGPVAAPFPGAVPDARNDPAIQLAHPPEARTSVYYTNASFQEVVDHYRVGARRVNVMEEERMVEIIVDFLGELPLSVYVESRSSGPDRWVSRAVDRAKEGLLATGAMGGADPAALQREAEALDERYAHVRRLHYPFVADAAGEFRPLSEVLFERYEAEFELDPDALAEEIVRLTMAGDREGVQRLMERMQGGGAEHWAEEYLAEVEAKGFRTKIHIDWR